MDEKKSTRGGARTPGPGKRLGRPRTSKGWSVISVRVTAETKRAWCELPELEQDAARAEVKAVISRAVGRLK